MAKKGTKRDRKKGKMQLSRYFQEFDKGDSVSVARELSVQSSFPERIQGRTGVVEGKRGRSYVVKIKDNKKDKIFLIEPIHLKKVKMGKTAA